MVGVEQGPHVTGELVQLGQPHTLLAATTGGAPGFAVIILFMVQLWKAKDQTFSSAPVRERACSEAGRRDEVALTSTR